MQNNILLGIFIGMLAPAIAFVLVQYTHLQESFLPDKPIALYVIAATVNLIIFRIFYRAGKDSLAKGILLMTFVAMLIFIFGTRFSI